jgi:hypothetical protein
VLDRVGFRGVHLEAAAAMKASQLVDGDGLHPASRGDHPLDGLPACEGSGKRLASAALSRSPASAAHVARTRGCSRTKNPSKSPITLYNPPAPLIRQPQPENLRRSNPCPLVTNPWACPPPTPDPGTIEECVGPAFGLRYGMQRGATGELTFNVIILPDVHLSC